MPDSSQEFMTSCRSDVDLVLPDQATPCAGDEHVSGHRANVLTMISMLALLGLMPFVLADIFLTTGHTRQSIEFVYIYYLTIKIYCMITL